MNVRHPASAKLTAAGITAEVRRRKVKRVTLRVYPPEGQVVLTAPLRTPERHLATVLTERSAWVVKQQRLFAAVPRRPVPLCVDGELLSVLGEEVPLRLVGADRTRPAAAAPAPVSGGELSVRARAGDEHQDRLAALRRALSAVARVEFAREVSAWAGPLGVRTPKLTVRLMRSRWGSCVVPAGNVTLNLALVTRTREALTYVVVHELAHLHEPNHGQRFWGIVERHLPTWREQRRSLGADPLWADALWADL